MEKFYLEQPSLERKNEIIEYLNEFVEYKSDINGSGSLDKIFDGYTFEQALDRCLNMESEKYAEKVGRCPGKTFLFIRESDNKIVGTINVRWNLSQEMLNFGGHIGYGIRPTERRKGYNKINLYLGLMEAKKLGLKKVMLDCDVNNIGSDKTLKALGGTLERTGVDPSDGTLTNVYWFDVENTLKKYKGIYESKISFKCLLTDQDEVNKEKNDKLGAKMMYGKKLWLREITATDDLEGLKFLQELVNEEGIMVAPAPKDIDENTYGSWLKSKEDMAKGINLPDGFIPCTTYWVMLDEKIIGLANIKHYLNDYLRKKGGHIGLSIAKDYRRQGLGLRTTKLLIEKARTEFGIEDILFTNEPENVASRQMCEKLGAELTDIDEHCHYWLRK